MEAANKPWHLNGISRLWTAFQLLDTAADYYADGCCDHSNGVIMNTRLWFIVSWSEPEQSIVVFSGCPFLCEVPI